MPWERRQWRAIAADYVRRYGREEGERRLRKLKAKHGGRVLSKAAKK